MPGSLVSSKLVEKIAFIVVFGALEGVSLKRFSKTANCEDILSRRSLIG